MNATVFLARATRYQLLATLLVTAATWFPWPQIALGTGLGGLLMTANLNTLRVIALKAAAASNPQRAYYFLWPIKFIGTLGALAMAVSWFSVDILGLMVGLFTLVVGLLLSYAHEALQTPSSLVEG